MKLRGINFGPIFGASGVQGFFGEGYFYHKLFRPFGLNFTGCTFVAKTTTLEKYVGNMAMKKDGITPRELLPKFVKLYFCEGMMLNAVGLSGPGAKALFEMGGWQERADPFCLSFMPVAPTPEERTLETKKFVELLTKYLPKFEAEVCLQLNDSCSNVGLNLDDLIDEVKTQLKIASVLDIPLMPKFNVLAPVKAVKIISDDANCDAICVSNAIPWGKVPETINWKKLFGSDISPLAKFDGGGLSGKPLLPLVTAWLREARFFGIKKPINAGGGILSQKDLGPLRRAGASSVFIGSVAILRPWRVKSIIQEAYRIFC